MATAFRLPPEPLKPMFTIFDQLSQPLTGCALVKGDDGQNGFGLIKDMIVLPFVGHFAAEASSPLLTIEDIRDADCRNTFGTMRERDATDESGGSLNSALRVLTKTDGLISCLNGHETPTKHFSSLPAFAVILKCFPNAEHHKNEFSDDLIMSFIFWIIK